MRRDARWVFVVLALPIVLACGTLEIGIERTPTPVLTPELPSPTPTSEPIVLASPSATLASPTATVEATLPSPLSRERITFPPGGTTFSFTTNLTRGAPKAYVLTIYAQQQLIVNADGDVTIVVLDSQNKTIVPVSTRQGHWVGAIPYKGDCTIILRGEGTFNITINIPPLGG
ncbi:hypothetical protein ANRL3_01161 [Anaerolineae bacterium]|nr:hypothetical protein ANRL3_01161 [Anaerolineae bacterium]